ncbi:MAG TPA: hypothetical protein DDZ80_30235 [Cyanobacteria bacterium UBA8803]|nr:hypothetical protein [Cyanobacteria bacterium UBA9273]HBL62513.1 hypothetical protein [Cyanobacteria bacterium UBA8803]
MLNRLLPTQSNHHPEKLPTYRLGILSLILILVVLESLQNGRITGVSVVSIVFGISILLPAPRGLLLVLGMLVLWLGTSFVGSDLLVLHKTILWGGASASGILVRSFLLRLEWERAAQTVLSTLIDSDIKATSKILLERVVSKLRYYTRADAIIALRELGS